MKLTTEIWALYPSMRGEEAVLVETLVAVVQPLNPGAVQPLAPRCGYPGCVEDNEDERCPRWLTGECAGPDLTPTQPAA